MTVLHDLALINTIHNLFQALIFYKGARIPIHNLKI